MVHRRGLTKAKRRGSSRYVILCLGIIIIVVLLFIGVRHLLTQWELFRVDKITISGNDQLEHDFLMDRCNGLLGENLFSVSQDEIYHRFNNVIRVKDVRFKRRLPDKLIILIEEREAFVQIRTNEGFLFPVDRDLIILDSERFYKDVCPVISSTLSSDMIEPGEILSDSLLISSINLLRRIVDYKPEFYHQISEIYYDDENVVLVDLNRGYKVYIGENNIEDKLERLEFVASNREIEKGVKVDLRFKDKLILRSEDK